MNSNRSSSLDDDQYEIVLQNGGDPVVVEDLYQSDSAYAIDIEENDREEERFEVRRKAVMLGRFKDMNQVREFLEESLNFEIPAPNA